MSWLNTNCQFPDKLLTRGFPLDSAGIWSGKKREKQFALLKTERELSVLLFGKCGKSPSWLETSNTVNCHWRIVHERESFMNRGHTKSDLKYILPKFVHFVKQAQVKIISFK